MKQNDSSSTATQWNYQIKSNSRNEVYDSNAVVVFLKQKRLYQSIGRKELHTI